MNEPEITLNLWYVCDDLGFIYSLRARAYVGVGSDEEKLESLRKHASTDYLIANVFSIPSQFHIEGQQVFHKDALDLMNPVTLFEEAIVTIQRDLPSQTPLDIPSKPLVCLTPLLGDEDGNIHPRIDEIQRLS